MRERLTATVLLAVVVVLSGSIANAHASGPTVACEDVKLSFRFENVSGGSVTSVSSDGGSYVFFAEGSAVCNGELTKIETPTGGAVYFAPCTSRSAGAAWFRTNSSQKFRFTSPDGHVYEGDGSLDMDNGYARPASGAIYVSDRSGTVLWSYSSGGTARCAPTPSSSSGYRVIDGDLRPALTTSNALACVNPLSGQLDVCLSDGGPERHGPAPTANQTPDTTGPAFPPAVDALNCVGDDVALATEPFYDPSGTFAAEPGGAVAEFLANAPLPIMSPLNFTQVSLTTSEATYHGLVNGRVLAAMRLALIPNGWLVEDFAACSDFYTP